MRLKKYLDFINEGLDYNIPVTITTDFAYDEDLNDYQGNTEEEQLIDMIKSFSKDIYKINEPVIEVIDFDEPGGSWPEVEITFKSITDAEKALYHMFAEDEWMASVTIANGLISDQKEREAFDFLKDKGEADYFNDASFSKEFLEELPENDKNYLRSLKGVDLFNL